MPDHLIARIVVVVFVALCTLVIIGVSVAYVEAQTKSPKVVFGGSSIHIQQTWVDGWFVGMRRNGHDYILTNSPNGVIAIVHDESCTHPKHNPQWRK